MYNFKIIRIVVFLTLGLPILLKGQWTPIANLPGAGTDGCFSATIDGKGYVGGGLGRNTLFAYDPASDIWTKKASIPGPAQRAWSASFVAEGNLYVVGGDSAFGGLLNDVWMYDPDQNQWTKKADFPGGRRDGMLCWAFNKINLKTKAYIGGGFDGQYILQDFYEYDPVTDSWTAIPDGMPNAMLFPSTFILDGKGYATFWEAGGFYNSLWEFDPVNYSWTEKAACPGTPRGEGIGFSVGNYGYAGLGQTAFSKAYTDIYRYDPSGDLWTKLADSFPASHTGWSCAFVIGASVFAGTGATIPDFNFSNKMFRLNLEGTGFILHQSSVGIELKVDLSRRVLDIISSDRLKEVVLYDIHGKIIKHVFNPSEKSISVEDLSQGIYTILIQTDKSVKSQCVIIAGT